MSGDIRRRAKLEGVTHPGPEVELQREEECKRIRQEAQRMNMRYVEERPIERELAWLEGDTAALERLEGDSLPPFTITEGGEVRSAKDGKLITTFNQTLAEVWYWQEVEWGGPGLIHDEEAEAVYTNDGEFALSRDCVNMQRYLRRRRGKGLE